MRLMYECPEVIDDIKEDNNDLLHDIVLGYSNVS